jgi:hypothetical protein
VQLTPLQAYSVRFLEHGPQNFKTHLICISGDKRNMKQNIRYIIKLLCASERQINHYLCGVGIATILLTPLLVYLDGLYLQHCLKNVWIPTLWVNVNWNSEVSNKSYQNNPLISIMLHEYQNLQYCTKTIFEVIFYNLRWQKSTLPINYAQKSNSS